MPHAKPSAALRPVILAWLTLAAGCTVTDPVRNLANQTGNAGPPANVAGDTDPPAQGGTRIALGQPVWSSPLPPPGPITVGRRR